MSVDCSEAVEIRQDVAAKKTQTKMLLLDPSNDDHLVVFNFFVC